MKEREGGTLPRETTNERQEQQKYSWKNKSIYQLNVNGLALPSYHVRVNISKGNEISLLELPALLWVWQLNL